MKRNDLIFVGAIVALVVLAFIYWNSTSVPPIEEKPQGPKTYEPVEWPVHGQAKG